MNNLNEFLKFESKFADFNFVATVFIKGNDLIININGPNDHLGGIGIGIPYIRKNGDQSANHHCISMPSHRDGELAAKISRIIAKITQRNTVVLLGIHFPNLTKPQLLETVVFSEKWAEEIGKTILSQLS